MPPILNPFSRQGDKNVHRTEHPHRRTPRPATNQQPARLPSTAATTTSARSTRRAVARNPTPFTRRSPCAATTLGVHTAPATGRPLAAATSPTRSPVAPTSEQPRLPRRPTPHSPTTSGTEPRQARHLLAHPSPPPTRNTHPANGYQTSARRLRTEVAVVEVASRRTRWTTPTGRSPGDPSSGRTARRSCNIRRNEPTPQLLGQPKTSQGPGYLPGP